MDEQIKMWHENEKVVRVSPDKVVNKLYRDGKFIESIIIPTVMYPLSGKPSVFTFLNTQRVTDEKVLQIFDSLPYIVGHCYDNSASLHEKLMKAGYYPEVYAGWLFFGEGNLPVHHCWIKLGDSILDMSDDATMLYQSGTAQRMMQETSDDSMRERLAEYLKESLSWPNSKRCNPVGQVSPPLLYVGCRNSPQGAKSEYRKLIERYPDHECIRNCKGERYNPTQKFMKERGIGAFE